MTKEERKRKYPFKFNKKSAKKRSGNENADVEKTEEENKCQKYKTWKIYFDDFNGEKMPDQVIEDILGYLKRFYLSERFGLKEHLDKIVASQVMFLDMNKFDSYDSDKGGGLVVETLKEFPDATLLLFSLCLHELLLQHQEWVPQGLGENFRITTRVLGYRIFRGLSLLKSDCVGKFISTTGTVSVVENVRVMPHSMLFECKKCSYKQWHCFKNDLFSYPSKCSSGLCIGRSFEPIYNETKCVEYQKIIMHENSLHDENNREKSPSSMICLLKSDLTDICSPGDTVYVCGILKGHENTEESDKSKIFFSAYIHANFINVDDQPISFHYSRLLQNMASNRVDGSEFIIKSSTTSNLFYKMVCSFCPSIFENYLLKSALLLCVLSQSDDQDGNFRRKNAHVLMIGEPGLGKSQLLKGVHSVAPKSIYVCGSSSSSAGLTVSLTKEAGSSEFSIEPGAIVLANKGVCCIDEFDKIPQYHDSLLEVMEQQCVSIAKSGTRCKWVDTNSITLVCKHKHPSLRPQISTKARLVRITA